jgi:hypothetical protein
MTAVLKSQSSPELVQKLRELEELANACYRDLQLLRVPKNLASWGALSRFVEILESTINRFETAHTQQFVATIINIGRSGSLLLDWIQKHGSRTVVPRSRFRWNAALGRAAALGFDLARHYEAFTGCFPAWHRDRAGAEIVGPRVVRFTWVGGAVGRRVSAFQKGFRSESEQKGTPIPSSPVPDTPTAKDRLARVLETCRSEGRLGFSYPLPLEYHEFLRPFYEQSLASVFRREDSLSLGAYALGAFRSLYAALLTICATHEILCFWWGKQRSGYPLNSAVMVKKFEEWVRLLCRLGSLPRDTVEAILDDLTFPVQGPRKPRDLLIHPFVPLDAGSRLLGLVPHFPLHSRPDENILRTCSYVSHGAYDAASQLKEQDMRRDLISALPAHIVAVGPVALPGGNPDLDLILEDRNSSTLVLAELKWIRKPLSVFERCDRDEEFLKGVEQLARIQRFLSSKPSYLAERGKVSRSLLDYSELRYLLIARDHFVWVDPIRSYPVIEFETFKRAVSKARTLHDASARLLTFDWLPVEGRDFRVEFQVACVSGVSIESEIFLPL